MKNHAQPFVEQFVEHFNPGAFLIWFLDKRLNNIVLAHAADVPAIYFLERGANMATSNDEEIYVKIGVQEKLFPVPEWYAEFSDVIGYDLNGADIMPYISALVRIIEAKSFSDGIDAVSGDY